MTDTDVVLAFDPDRRTNSRAMSDAARLGWVGDRVLDLTYGRGAFWIEYKPTLLATNDLYATSTAGILDLDARVDFRNPVALDEAFGQFHPQTVVFDPDYRLNGTPDRGDFDDRFGTDVAKTVQERMTDIMLGAAGAASLQAPILLVKCQDQVSSGHMHRQTKVVDEATERFGYRWADQLYVRNNPPGQRSQKHARQNFSVLMCLRLERRKRWT